MSNRTKHKLLTELNGIFVRARRVYKLPANPVADVEKPHTRNTMAIEVFSPEEVWALVRAAEPRCSNATCASHANMWYT